jgi:hypothetical protein
MIESIASAILTSSVILACATFVLKKYWDKRLKHYFDERLERLSAELGVRSALEIEFNKNRLDDYNSIAQLVKRNRKYGEKVFSGRGCYRYDLIDEWEACTDELETAIYRSVLNLKHDGLYDLLHACKNGLVVTRNYFADHQYLLGRGKTEEAKMLTPILRARLEESDTECERIIAMLDLAVHELVHIS